MAEDITYKPVRWTDPDGAVWERSGECKQCGACCEDVYLPFDDYDFARFVRLHLGGLLTEAVPGKLWKLFIHTPCEALHHGQCMIYANRPEICKEWPVFLGPNPNCGYKWTKVVDGKTS